MPYHIDHRPSALSDVIGNFEAVESLKAAVAKLEAKKKPPRVFLLSGDSGCGKTTLARCFANDLHCRGINIVEINSANLRGIDIARELQAMTEVPPIGGYRVVILDEVHKSTNDFQNAMLKVLEDGSDEKNFFFLCTTDPGKLLKTILSRCTKLNVKPLEKTEAHELLKLSIKKENLKLPKGARTKIVEAAEGVPRSLLILLEQIAGAETIEQVCKILKDVSISLEENPETVEIFRALLKKASWKEIATLLKPFQDEPEKFRRAILGYMSAVLLNSGNHRAAIILDCFKEPFYDTGKPGLVLACYEATISK